MNLVVNVNESNKPSSIGLMDQFPSGWSVSSVSFGGVFKTSPDRLEWVFSNITSPVQDKTVTYVLWIPAYANGTYSFYGNSDLGEGSLINTIGDNLLIVREGCTLAGDSPPCGIVSLNEVITGINEWALGQMTLQEIIALINTWATG